MKKILLMTMASLFAASGALAQETPKAPDATTKTQATKPAGDMTNLTEADARAKLEAAGYTDITGLTASPEGGWSATVMKNGAATKVIVNPKGDVTAAPM